MTTEEIIELVKGLPDNPEMLNAIIESITPKADMEIPSIAEIGRAIAGDNWQERDHSEYLSTTLADDIARVEAGHSVRRVISMPPGSGKSTIGSVATPLHLLSAHPDWNVGIVSAEQSLANKWSRDIRRAVIADQVPVKLASDSTALTEWETTEGGSLIARGVGATIVGRRLNVLIIDDPIKDFAEALSSVARNLLWERWVGVLSQRLHPVHLVLLIQTRWHGDDLAGRVIEDETDDWQVTKIPAIAEANDPLGREIGEPMLSPQRVETKESALERWNKIRERVGSYVFDASYQQNPAPPGGATFQADWFKWYEPHELPPNTEGTWITSWDLTFGTGNAQTGDFVVGQVWQYHEGQAYLIDQVRGRWQFTEQLRQIRELAERYPHATAHLIEKAADGFAAIDTLVQEIPGIIPIPPKGSKEIRAQAVSPMVEAGQVWLPSKVKWADDLIMELQAFPTGGTHDDQVDALTQALKRFREPSTATIYAPESVRAISSARSLSALRRGAF